MSRQIEVASLTKKFIGIAVAVGVFTLIMPTSTFAAGVTITKPVVSISADTASIGGTGAYTAISGPVITESSSADISIGTLQLVAPSGFEFNTASLVRALETKTIGLPASCNNASRRIRINNTNGQFVTPTPSTITINITQSSNSLCYSTITFSGIFVRPINGMPLASGPITLGGTTIIKGVSPATSLGDLTEIAGAVDSANSLLSANPTSISTDGGSSVITIVAKDKFGNPIPGISPANVIVSSTGASDVLVQPSTPTDVNGSTSASISSTMAGSSNISVSINGVIVSQTASVVFTPGIPTFITINQAPVLGSSVDAAFSTQPVIYVTDQNGNTVADGILVSATVAGGGTGTLRNSTATTLGGMATFSGLGYSKSNETFIIDFTAGGVGIFSSILGPLTDGALASIVVTPANSTIDITGSQTFTATGLDQFGNNLGDVSAGTVWAINDGGAGIFVGSQYNAATTGNFQVDGTYMGFTNSVNLQVIDLTALSIAITTQPSGSGSVDNVLSSQPIVLVQDGNGVPAVDGTLVTPILVSGTGVLRGTPAATLNGIATFVDIGYSKPNEFFTIKFQIGTLESPESANIGQLTVGSLASLVVSPSSTSISADSTQAFSAQGFDQFGNDLGDLTVTSTFGISSGAGGSFTGNVYTANNAGSWIVSAQIGSVTGTTPFSVTPGVITHISLSAPTPKTTAQTSTITIKGRDQFNNITTNQSGSVIVLSADNGGSLASTILTLTNGSASTTLSKTTAGIVNVTALSSGFSPVTTQVTFTSSVIITQVRVTGISAVKTFATADDTYANGWSWIFDVTAPDAETNLAMKFADWVNGPNSISVAGNIRFYSAQSSNANNSGTAITIPATATYSSTASLNADLDPVAPGRQIQITVEAKVPVGSTGGSYSTSYGILRN